MNTRGSFRALAVGAWSSVAALALTGCGGVGSICGGTLKVPCSAGMFCEYAEGMCDEGATFGLCASVPDFCTEVFSPVCGCDGATYGNQCFAFAAGQSVASRGECPSDKICGGIAAFQCGDGEFCKYEEGSCGQGDQSGVCTAVPDVCTQEFAPICGCDAVTYDNECSAYAAGTSVASRGECTGAPG